LVADVAAGVEARITRRAPAIRMRILKRSVCALHAVTAAVLDDGIERVVARHAGGRTLVDG
jgi:hypothetical protein